MNSQMGGVDDLYYGPKRAIKVKNYLRMFSQFQKYPNP